MRLQRIAVISPSNFPGFSGDTANYLELIRGFRRKGFRVTLVCPQHPQGRMFDEKMQKEGITVVRVPFRPPRLAEIANGKVILHALRLMIFYAIEFIRTMAALIESNAKYVIIRHSILTMPLAPLLKILKIKSTADGEVLSPLSINGLNIPRFILKIFSTYERKILSLYTFYLPSTNSQIELLTRMGFPRSRIILRNIGVDTNRVPVHNLEEIPRDTFGYFGVLEKRQNVGHLIRSWGKVVKRNPSTKLFIIGDGSMKSDLKKLARDLGVADSIIFYDGVPREILWDRYFKLFRITVIPRSSFCWSTPTNASIKLVEALAAGKPIIATRVLGIADMVKEEDGIVFVEPDDEDSFASAILKLLGNEHMIHTLSQKAIRASQRFNIDPQLDELLKALGLCGL